MSQKLQSLVIKNFRSIRGEVVVPLDAQVVLIHGSNGMGKTSILSALELGLTGRIAHLADDGVGYQKYLTNFGSDGGKIELKLDSPLPGNLNIRGSVEFSETAFSSKPLLSPDHARFFSERCFLPQSALGRLLEIYDEQTASTNSPLTLFVKELLGLDPLDALVDGLHPALHLSRLRNLAPEYRRIEDLKLSLEAQVKEIRGRRKTRQIELDSLTVDLNEKITGLMPELSIDVEDDDNRNALKAQLESGKKDDVELQKAHRLRSELRSASENWSTLPDASGTRTTSSLESQSVKATSAFHDWSNASGQLLDIILEEMRHTFPNILPSDRGPERARAFAEERAQSEIDRCERVLQRAADAEQRLAKLNSTIDRASAKLQELDNKLYVGVTDVQAFARALAGVTPHISDDNCPVCDRNFSETDRGSLAAHVAAKIGTLTIESGRLQAVAEERANESQSLVTAKRELLSANQERVAHSELTTLRTQKSEMQRRREKLNAMQAEVQLGTGLMEQASSARAHLRAAQKNNELASELISEIWYLVESITGKSASDFLDLDEALKGAMVSIEKKVAEIEVSNALRISCLRYLDSHDTLTLEIARFEANEGELSKRIERIDSATGRVSKIRGDSKLVSNSASLVRSSIVKRVFSQSLNTLWRDLFLRLAPSEQFVPAFKLPTDSKGNVEAVLETLHRSGKASGSPGAMLSQGNLNTAALTLFLALHLSVPVKQPWLVLDDPVQSMDDVHITQMAALLRTLSKSMNRQIIVAVHERALFDYLTLELSPAFPDDSLISVEVSKNFEGETVVSPQVFTYERDPAIAA